MSVTMVFVELHQEEPDLPSGGRAVVGAALVAWKKESLDVVLQS